MGSENIEFLTGVLYFKSSTRQLFFNKQQILRGEGVIYKCRLETQVNILELQCFYIIIN